MKKQARNTDLHPSVYEAMPMGVLIKMCWSFLDFHHFLSEAMASWGCGLQFCNNKIRDSEQF
jgi:hypothetical protein